MKKIMLVVFILTSASLSLPASDFKSKYDKYVDKLQKERDRISDSRDNKAELRRWNNDLDKITNRREFADKLRKAKSSIRDEVKRVF